MLDDGVTLQREALPFASPKWHAKSPAAAGRDPRFLWTSIAGYGEQTMQQAKTHQFAVARSIPPQIFRGRDSSKTSTSLHAQREACEAFIKSQAGEGWRLVRTAYDDGGLSGGRWNGRRSSAC